MKTKKNKMKKDTPGKYEIGCYPNICQKGILVSKDNK